jgi:hypothetical protein
MALFGFSDISFNKGATDRKGPLSPLVGSEFEKSTFRYPLDVGNADKAHYLVIYIRQQRQTQFKGNLATGGDAAFDKANFAKQEGAKLSIQGAIKSAQSGNLGNYVAGDIANKVNSSLNQLNNAAGGALSGIAGAAQKALGGAIGGINNLFGQSGVIFGGSSAQTQAIIDTSIKKITNKSFLQTTKLTTDAIALYMPDTLNYSYSQGYDDIPIGNELGGKILAAGGSAVDAFKSGTGGEDSLGALAKGAATAGASIGKSVRNEAAAAIASGAGAVLGENTGRLGFTAVTGTVRNPMLEMIYKSPNFRTFQFDFTFYPRDEREALEVQRIIERVRFHQAPELVSDAQGFLVPPSEFDIKFYYGGTQNPNIPPISTCVLEKIDVNYAPNGFSAYEVPGENQPSLGRTGMPVAINLQLSFKETTYLTKADFKQDRGTTQAKV